MCRSEDHGGAQWLCPVMALVALAVGIAVVWTLGLALPLVAPIGLAAFAALAAMKGL